MLDKGDATAICARKSAGSVVTRGGSTPYGTTHLSVSRPLLATVVGAELENLTVGVGERGFSVNSYDASDYSKVKSR